MKLEVGDYVRIEPLSDEEKQNYRFGWVYSHSDPYTLEIKFKLIH